MHKTASSPSAAGKKEIMDGAFPPFTVIPILCIKLDLELQVFMIDEFIMSTMDLSTVVHLCSYAETYRVRHQLQQPFSFCFSLNE